ncbi:hypothetical protein F9L33_13100 [Amylibacter sp. SFDW26]|uniref:hypothetical protein n=1 Tax=Amylibacter sp. SFDW26 TaxID=2652722 RepID=UPI001262229C|nr:hypothetical protein [Amylibacter sp. SFDW26]KAB7613521.1 hypothetical protein F9L33_13100 [Amylibacter sp. SFDW26]
MWISPSYLPQAMIFDGGFLSRYLGSPANFAFTKPTLFESQKALQNRHSFDEMFELAMGFLANPWKLWKLAT